MGSGNSQPKDEEFKDFSDDELLASARHFRSTQPERSRRLISQLLRDDDEAAERLPARVRATRAYCSNKIEPALHSMVEDLLMHQPEDVDAHMRGRLSGKGGATDDGAVTLRIIAVNDVYALDNFPALHTLIAEHRTKNTITTLAGDFVAPSLLSSLDHGHGMVDCMNLVPFTHVCFGNHESDIPLPELVKRIKQFNGCWLNSNMRDLATVTSLDAENTPEYDVVEVRVGNHVRRIGLVGVLSDDPALYRKPTKSSPGAFGGAKIESVDDTLARLKRHLETVERCDLVVPLTHQYVPEDTRTCEARIGGTGFPLIIGGHDHHAFTETIAGSLVLKAGMDAAAAFVIDVTWHDAATLGASPQIEYKLLNVAAYPPNPLVLNAVNKHNTLVRALDYANLTEFLPEWGAQSSRKVRTEVSGIGTLLCSAIRGSLHCDACVLNAGCIRAGVDYDSAGAHRYFTYGDLKREMPFDSEIVVLPLPGAVLAETLAFSRAKAPHTAKSCFLQTDFQMVSTCNTPGDWRLTEVHGAPLEPERIYQTAVLMTTVDGMDNLTPLVDWARANAALVPPEDSGIPAKVLLIRFFAKEIFSRIFAVLHDADHPLHEDAHITRDDLLDAIHRIGWGVSGDNAQGADEGAELLVDRIMAVVDVDGSGELEADEVKDVLETLTTPRSDSELECTPTKDAYLEALTASHEVEDGASLAVPPMRPSV